MAEFELMNDNGLELGVVSAGVAQAIANANSRNESTSFPKVMLEWRNLSCSVDLKLDGKHVKRTVIDGISGVAQPGELVAIMGSSGAGKTTLFNILSQRITNEPPFVVSGDIMLNGRPATQDMLRGHSAYVMQHDLLLYTLSARESLNFCAGLRLPAYYTEKERADRVEQVIRELRIQKCADAQVGNMRERGISGGERKRAAIGVELIANPSLILLDEPTTGLDSFTALKLVTLLKKFAKTGRTVVMTIHQPSLEIFQLFDKLIVMSSGKYIYNGPAQQSVQYFSSLGYRCPAAMNPADFFLRTLEHQSEIHKAVFFDAYNRSRMAQMQNDNSLQNLLLPELEPQLDFERVDKMTEFKLLVKRGWTHYIRQRDTIKVRMFEMCFTSLFLGLLYYNIGYNQASITDRLGVLFNILMATFVASVVAVLVTFPDERPLFLREKFNNMYSTNTYFFAKIVSEMSFQIFYPVVMSVVVYWMVGLRSGVSHFLIFLGCNILLVNVGQAVGLLIGAAVSEVETARILVPFAILPFSLVCGLFITADEIPTYLIWMKFMSVFRYGYEIYLLNEFLGLSLYCDDDEYTTVDGEDYCEYTDGDDVLTDLDIDLDSMSSNFAILVCLYFGFMGLSWLFLTLRKDKL